MDDTSLLAVMRSEALTCLVDFKSYLQVGLNGSNW